MEENGNKGWNMKALTRTKAFEVRLYMGSRKGYGEEQYALHHIVRAIMQAVGMVNDHLIECFRHTTRSKQVPTE